MPVDWAAAVAVLCISCAALAVLALSIGYAIRGDPLPGPLATALGVLLGIGLAYIGPRPPDRHRRDLEDTHDRLV